MGGRYAVLVSDEDNYERSLLRTNTWGILGYSPERRSRRAGAEYAAVDRRVVQRGEGRGGGWYADCGGWSRIKGGERSS